MNEIKLCANSGEQEGGDETSSTPDLQTQPQQLGQCSMPGCDQAADYLLVSKTHHETKMSVSDLYEKSSLNGGRWLPVRDAQLLRTEGGQFQSWLARDLWQPTGEQEMVDL